MANIEPIMARYPKIGLRAWVEMTSDATPNAGNNTM